MDIRPATVEDALRLTEVAITAKRHWGYPEHWIERWTPQLTITPAFIREHTVCVAIADDEIVGFYALSHVGDKAVLEHMWIVPERIGTGIGRRLWEHAIEQASQMGARIIEIESDPHAEGFYLRMGARRIGETLSEIDGQPRRLPLLVVDVARRQQSA